MTEKNKKLSVLYTKGYPSEFLFRSKKIKKKGKEYDPCWHYNTDLKFCCYVKL